MINRHSIVLFIVLVAMGFGLFTMVGFQRKNAIAPVASTGGGLVVNVGSGIIPSTTVTNDGSGATTAPVVDDAAAADGAACP